MWALYLNIILSLAFFFCFTAISLLREWKESKIEEEIIQFETMTEATTKEHNARIWEYAIYQDLTKDIWPTYTYCNIDEKTILTVQDFFRQQLQE
jgi:K+ transporter